MSKRKAPGDEKLIESLREKLDWYTFEATEDEFDDKQVQAITDLLDALDPLPDVKIREDGTPAGASPAAADKLSATGGQDAEDAVSILDAEAALKRFQKKYQISDEDLAKKTRKIVPFTDAEFSEEFAFGDKRKFGDVRQADPAAGPSASGAVQDGAKKRGRFGRFIAGPFGKIAVAACAAIVVMAVGVGFLGFGSNALSQRSFFEFVRDGVNSFKITVTGDERETKVEEGLPLGQDEKVYYDSWEEVRKEREDILVPSYLPEGAELEELSGTKMDNYMLFRGKYRVKDNRQMLILSVKSYEKYYGEFNKENGWDQIGHDDQMNIDYYKKEDMYLLIMARKQSIYTLIWDDLEELKEVSKGMK